jgi:hypothetical protein
MANYRESISISTNSSLQQILDQSNISSSNLEVKVFFKGAKCNPESSFFKVPPCSGPYPNYEFYIYAANNTDLKKTLISNGKTNIDGNYRVWLEPNKYVIQTELDKLSSTPHSFTINKGESVTVDITIDTGIR